MLQKRSIVLSREIEHEAKHRRVINCVNRSRLILLFVRLFRSRGACFIHDAIKCSRPEDNRLESGRPASQFRFLARYSSTYFQVPTCFQVVWKRISVSLVGVNYSDLTMKTSFSNRRNDSRYKETFYHRLVRIYFHTIRLQI